MDEHKERESRRNRRNRRDRGGRNRGDTERVKWASEGRVPIILILVSIDNNCDSKFVLSIGFPFRILILFYSNFVDGFEFVLVLQHLQLLLFYLLYLLRQNLHLIQPIIYLLTQFIR